jgi:hypothetical protein
MRVTTLARGLSLKFHFAEAPQNFSRSILFIEFTAPLCQKNFYLFFVKRSLQKKADQNKPPKKMGRKVKDLTPRKAYKCFITSAER